MIEQNTQLYYSDIHGYALKETTRDGLLELWSQDDVEIFGIEPEFIYSRILSLIRSGELNSPIGFVLGRNGETDVEMLIQRLRFMKDHLHSMHPSIDLGKYNFEAGVITTSIELTIPGSEKPRAIPIIFHVLLVSPDNN